MNRFEWVAATSLDDALAQLSSGAVAKAGGIDLLDRMKEGIDAPKRLVNLRAIPGLDRIEPRAGGVAIGPLVTMASLAESPQIQARWPALAHAAGKAATPQIRNVATVGGNLLQRPRCWYFRSAEFPCLKKGGEECFGIPGDNRYHSIFGNGVCAAVHPSSTAVPLMAYGAILEIAGPRGRREAPIETFFVHPDDDVLREHPLGAEDVLTAIRLPAPAPGTRSAYVEQGEKESFDWALADAAAVLVMDGPTVRRASLVLGAAAPVPMRAAAAEEFLRGKRVDPATAR
ncbi:MAG: FAD binding domain-containing protein, partial [Acidobacteria bacterium]|nr:FAD binding domain-containing protein [Acidobacteriota bacterium]